MNIRGGLALLMMGAVFLAGCSLAPDYLRPDMPITDSFKEDGIWHLAQPADQHNRGEWWPVFQDPLLNQMETQLEKDSFELVAALARYDAANAYLSEQSSRLYPEINAIGN